MRETSWPVHHFTIYDAYLATKPVRILLAEDDIELRSLLTASLSKEGYDVIAVANGRELLDLLGSQLLDPKHSPPVDLIISDHRMPGLTGLEVLSGLRGADWATPFIVITAFGDAETHEEARRLGASAIFDKPFDLGDLKTAVVNVIHPLQ